MPDKIKMLFISANPTASHLALLRLDKEVRELRSVIPSGGPSNSIELMWPQFAARSKDFRDALLKEQPQIIHFSGHGTPRGIVLEDDSGRAVTVDMQAMAELLSALTTSVRLIFLNSCYMQEQAELLRDISDYVVGTDTAIPDDEAIDFASSFYATLVSGRSVNAAMKAAKAKLRMDKAHAQMSHGLLVRPGINPNEPFTKQVKEPEGPRQPNRNKKSNENRNRGSKKGRKGNRDPLDPYDKLNQMFKEIEKDMPGGQKSSARKRRY